MINTIGLGRSFPWCQPGFLLTQRMWLSLLLEIFACFWDADTKLPCTGKGAGLCSWHWGIIWGWLTVSSLRELKDGECLTGAWCHRGDAGHHLGPPPQSSAVPICSSAILISWDCSWVHSEASLHFPSPHNKLWPSASKFSPHPIAIFTGGKDTIRPLFHDSPQARTFTSTFVFFLSISPKSERSWSLGGGTRMLKDLFHSAISWRSYLG